MENSITDTTAITTAAATAATATTTTTTTVASEENGTFTAITSDPDTIKAAQEDLSKMDIHVCGSCNEVYHFVEEFQMHKSSEKCTGVPTFKCENSEKPQVWGFSLWKAKKLKCLQEKQEENPTSWEIYQRWCKLAQDEKNTWIAAGQRLQFAKKLVNAKIELNDESFDGSITNSDGESKDDVKENNVNNNSVDEKSSTKSKKNTAERSQDTTKEEFVVEKVLSKRFHPRRRHWEYEIKWKNYEDTTFEPLTHLENCKELVTDFEDNLKAEQEKAKEKVNAAPPRQRGRPKGSGHSASPATSKAAAAKVSTPMSAGNRPIRSCKQKALSQVKQWCGTMSDEESVATAKRIFDSSSADEDAIVDKKIKLDHQDLAADEDTEEEDEETVTIRKLTKVVNTYNANGVPKKLPDNVLIPDDKGVVRISQKQLPSLSSGVYIMSKTSGIIKLDAAASKIATSGGQAIVKVNSRGAGGGQTQVRIIKKEVSKSMSTTTTTPPTPPRTFTRSAAARASVDVVKKADGSTYSTRSPVRQYDHRGVSKANTSSSSLRSSYNVQPIGGGLNSTLNSNSGAGDDSDDDGIEELEFPTGDLPIPEPESPPGDFVLDPSTGKIAGKDYTEEEEAAALAAVKAAEEAAAKATDNIDNIVKLAAADITEDDLQPEPASPVKSSPSNSNVVVRHAKITPSTTILQRTLQQQQQQLKGKPRILNQSVGMKVARTSTGGVVMSPVLRPLCSLKPSPVQRSRISIGSAGNTPIHVRNNSGGGSNNVATYMKTNNVKKIGNTTIYKTTVRHTSPAGAAVAAAIRHQSPAMMQRICSATTPAKVAMTATGTPPPPRILNKGQATQLSGQQRTILQQQKSGVTTTSVRTPVKMTSSAIATPTTTTKKTTTIIGVPTILAEEETVNSIVTSAHSPTIGISTTELAAILQEPVCLGDSPTTTEDSTKPMEIDEIAAATSTANSADLSTFTLAGGDRLMLITGDDGTVYQVAGQNEEGQTILLTQDSDGQQQCLLVTNKISPEDLITAETVDEAAAVAEAAAAAAAGTSSAKTIAGDEGNGETSTISEEEDSDQQAAIDGEVAEGIAAPVGEESTPVTTDETAEQLETAEATADSTAADITNNGVLIGAEQGPSSQEPLEVVTDEQPVVAQFVRTEPPSPGGTHKVVVMLPDGNCVITPVSPEEYASLEMGK